jgi:hypothetical protein
MERKLTPFFCTQVYGYSRLMGDSKHLGEVLTQLPNLVR